MYKGYININIRLQKKKYIAYIYYFDRLLFVKSTNLMDCLFQIKSKINCIYNKNNILTLFTYLYYDNESDEWLPIYTDVFNNLIKLI